MKKTLIVLCGTALLLVGLFCFGFVATTTAQPAGEPGMFPWQNARAMEVKMQIAKEKDCTDAIKMISGIADATVVTHKRLNWDRNAWARTHLTSVGVFVEAIDNRPLSADTIGAIGRIVAPLFGISDMAEIRIVDTKHHREYNGAGEEMTDGRRQTATNAGNEPRTLESDTLFLNIRGSLDPNYIELLKKRVEVAKAELALLEAEFALLQAKRESTTVSTETSR